MKTRNGFVSNSSSSSFILRKKGLSDFQVKSILDYGTSEQNIDGWSFNIIGEEIHGFTSMDNGELDVFLTEINIPNENIIDWSSF